ncbi:MAG: class I SAM-dependent methyltransferase [Candidatus Hydrogenedentes bacterium]|nr:class I SAM-dependent methyltransferase [Candidatus Hydrogenedentota bacterium]
MNMNALEKLMVNNPLRTRMLRQMATSLLRGAGASLAGTSVLEIGCGQGAGTEIALRHCGADRIVAFDYDGAQLARAHARHRARGERRAVLFQGDAARLPFADAQFDAVIEFAILHHVPEWPLALAEIARVLRPGGLFLYEEYLRGFTANPVTKLFLVHPEEGMFTAEMFYSRMDAVGFARDPRQYRWGPFRLAGTARRADSGSGV